ncbi:MAG: hypothetical protein A3A44_02655 [Candidatus Sungbacteria bacterium RIFCSPLOWO2_01_FULL_60_25]|uniref:Uncharacterized protein n=1 Tax=Candidatus Sungbacteria bacterium RIFCSPLOWO2_01_FULL_60_25 TaxID=1802281 RepID=A0A1G2LDR6_9BACT|nr:MAG: hypothetical protein A3A44_02655 [Candidatus Sungbacteria bacterium RIFCSPLOWO2_01_FULL_60_25]
MYNWSTDEKKIKAAGRTAYERWKLEQTVNYGLRGEKISARLLKKYWQKIFMDAPTRRYLSFLLWPGKKKF